MRSPRDRPVCTLVAGSDALAGRWWPTAPEAWRVQPDDPIAFDSDQVNTKAADSAVCRLK